MKSCSFVLFFFFVFNLSSLQAAERVSKAAEKRRNPSSSGGSFKQVAAKGPQAETSRKAPGVQKRKAGPSAPSRKAAPTSPSSKAGPSTKRSRETSQEPLQAQPLLICPHCHQIQLDPQQLPCGHSLCEDCLIRHSVKPTDASSVARYTCAEAGCGNSCEMTQLRAPSVSLRTVADILLKRNSEGRQRQALRDQRVKEEDDALKKLEKKWRQDFQIPEGTAIVFVSWRSHKSEGEITRLQRRLKSLTPRQKARFLKMVGLTGGAVRATDNGLELLNAMRNLGIPRKGIAREIQFLRSCSLRQGRVFDEQRTSVQLMKRELLKFGNL